MCICCLQRNVINDDDDDDDYDDDNDENDDYTSKQSMLSPCRAITFQSAPVPACVMSILWNIIELFAAGLSGSVHGGCSHWRIRTGG